MNINLIPNSWKESLEKSEGLLADSLSGSGPPRSQDINLEF